MTFVIPATFAGNAGALITSRADLSGALAPRFAHLVNLVDDFGGVADALLTGAAYAGTDNGPAFQRAHDFLAANGGGVVLVPAGHYLIKTPVIITSMVMFEGQGFQEGSTGVGAGPGIGSWLIIGASFIGSVISPFTLQGAGVNGWCGFRGFGISELHPAPVSGWAPSGYPPVFNVTGTYGQTVFKELYAFPVNKLLSFVNSARFTVDDLHGQVFTYGVFINNAEDASRIGNTHFFPYWSQSPFVCNWQQANGDAIWVQRMDGLRIAYAFCIFYRSGLRLDSSSSGNVNDIFVHALYADGCYVPLWVTGTQATGQISQIYTGGETVSGGMITGSVGIQIDGDCNLQIGTCKIFNCAIQAINLDSTTVGSILSIGSLYVQNWNQANGGAPVISAAAVPGTAHEIKLGSPPILVGGNGAPIITTPSEANVSGASLIEVYDGVVTGQTYGMNGSTALLYLQGLTTATIATATVILPRYPFDGQEAAIWCTEQITALTVTSVGGTTPVANSINTTLLPSVRQVFRFNISPGNGQVLPFAGAWYRMQ